jgi:hypothetical protein
MTWPEALAVMAVMAVADRLEMAVAVGDLPSGARGLARIAGRDPLNARSMFRSGDP